MGSLGRLKLCLIYPCFSKCLALPLAHSFIQYIVYTRHGCGNGQRKSRRSRDWQVNKELPTAISGDLRGKPQALLSTERLLTQGEESAKARRKGRGRTRRRGQECGRPWPAAGCTPRYLDELFKLLNVGLQLGFLDAQLLPAQVQSFHSPLKCLGWRKQEGQKGLWHGNPGRPQHPLPSRLSPQASPLSTPRLAQSRASRDTGTPESLGLFLCLQREHRATIQDPGR